MRIAFAKGTDPDAIPVEVEGEVVGHVKLIPENGRTVCGHRAWASTDHCAEMICWNYVEKARP